MTLFSLIDGTELGDVGVSETKSLTTTNDDPTRVTPALLFNGFPNSLLSNTDVNNNIGILRTISLTSGMENMASNLRQQQPYVAQPIPSGSISKVTQPLRGVSSLSSTSLPLFKSLKKTNFYGNRKLITESSIAYNNKRRRRRTFGELERDFVCPYISCERVYASKTALMTHVRNKHQSKGETIHAKDIYSKPKLFKDKITYAKRNNSRSVIQNIVASGLELHSENLGQKIPLKAIKSEPLSAMKNSSLNKEALKNSCSSQSSHLDQMETGKEDNSIQNKDKRDKKKHQTPSFINLKCKKKSNKIGNTKGMTLFNAISEGSNTSETLPEFMEQQHRKYMQSSTSVMFGGDYISGPPLNLDWEGLLTFNSSSNKNLNKTPLKNNDAFLSEININELSTQNLFDLPSKTQEGEHLINTSENECDNSILDNLSIDLGRSFSDVNFNLIM